MPVVIWVPKLWSPDLSPGSVYAQHVNAVKIQMSVLDTAPSDDPKQFPPSLCMAHDLATLLRCLADSRPPRHPIAASALQPQVAARVTQAIKASSKPRL